jgi:NAD(P)H-hydrate epimerase
VKKILSKEEMRAAEQFTIEKLSVSDDCLVERAAFSSFLEIKKRFPADSQCLILAGPGNNGADALALSRILIEYGYNVSVYFYGNNYSECNLIEKKRLNEVKNNKLGKLNFLSVLDLSKDGYFDFIVDGLYGIGLNRDLSPDASMLIERINSYKAFKIALDIPSGLNSNTGTCSACFKADLTVTFGFIKKGLLLNKGPDYTGELVLLKTGIFDKENSESSYKALEDSDFYNLLPDRKNVSHKGTYGKTLIIAGSEDIYGACLLASKACFYVGAGMVKIFTHKNNVDNLQREIPEAMISSYDNDPGKLNILEEKLIKDIDWADTVMVGSGLGTGPVSFNILETLVRKADLDKKIVIFDADALNIFAENKELFYILSERIKNSFVECVMTPHKKELKGIIKMLGLDFLDPEEACEKIFEISRIVVVDKGPDSGIYGEERFINLTGNDGLATAGSGDVLSGILAGLLFQIKDKCDFEEAVAMGVYLHGLLADRVAERKSKASLMAGDLILEIPQVIA